MKTKSGIALLSVSAVTMAGCSSNEATTPNVIIILADDLGYGDVSAYGSTTIETPNIDYLAHGGICFTNGYASSATSTPSRYALMTGMYPWKNSEAKILPGDAPLIIDERQYTLPRMMRQAGYKTAAIGKWNLGMGRGSVNWNETVKPGANETGFDYSCLIAATNDRVPTVYVENGKVVGLDANDPIEVSYEKNFEGEPDALANPESEYVELLTTPEQRAEVEKYLENVKKRTERERIADRRVTGVFSGSYAINPVSLAEIPIYISDYVLAGYGTGAIMAVPAQSAAFASRLIVHVASASAALERIMRSPVWSFRQKAPTHLLLVQSLLPIPSGISVTAGMSPRGSTSCRLSNICPRRWYLYPLWCCTLSFP